MDMEGTDMDRSGVKKFRASYLGGFRLDSWAVLDELAREAAQAKGQGFKL